MIDQLEKMFRLYREMTDPAAKRYMRLVIQKVVAAEFREIKEEEEDDEKTTVYPDLTPEEYRLAEEVGKIPAIKSVRARLGLDLLNAKRLVEDRMRATGRKCRFD